VLIYQLHRYLIKVPGKACFAQKAARGTLIFYHKMGEAIKQGNIVSVKPCYRAIVNQRGWYKVQCCHRVKKQPPLV